MTTITLGGTPISTIGEIPKNGTKAPDFVLTATDLSNKSLSDFDSLNSTFISLFVDCSVIMRAALFAFNFSKFFNYFFLFLFGSCYLVFIHVEVTKVYLCVRQFCLIHLLLLLVSSTSFLLRNLWRLFGHLLFLMCFSLFLWFWRFFLVFI